MTDKRIKKVFLVAGEVSGDTLGARLISDLKKIDPHMHFAGIGGDKMAAQGVQSLFPMSDLSVMGILAVLKRLPLLLKRIRQTVRAVVENNPDVLVLIDSPDFTHRVAKRVKIKAPHILIYKWVAPSVWAWRSGRAKAMTAYIDHVMALLPFEPEVMQKLGGPPTTCVGHPLARAETLVNITPGEGERPPLEAVKKPTLLVLPGSRMGEVKKLLPVFEATILQLQDQGFEFDTVIPTVSAVHSYVKEQTSAWKNSPQICLGEKAKWRAFRKSHAALAASGTVSLELALAGVPHIVAYRLDLIAGFLAPRLIKIWTASLPNLILERPVIREYLEAFCRADLLSKAIGMLLTDTPERAAQIESFGCLKIRMQQGNSEVSQLILEAMSFNCKSLTGSKQK